MGDSYRDFIDTIRNKSDIVSLVSDYIDLKKRGGKYWGCCPFHEEKTPSFSVSPDKGLFYCFGCNAGGDAISFIQKKENLIFKEALVFIANRLGIPVPEERQSKYQIEKAKENQEIYKINELAMEYFQACLYKTKFGQEALKYLKNRSIDETAIKMFSLGVALPGYETLFNAFTKRNVSVDKMLSAHLIAKQNRGHSYYDYFRSRIMIPIKDARSRVVGFGGRIFGEGNPKYLNTAENNLFNKRHLLYGLNLSIDNIREKQVAIVVEGYMDVISLYSHGVNVAVASLGTAFSEEQARLLSRITKNVVFCYDADNAGQQAAFRAISIARKAGLRAKAFFVDDGKDPDEFVQKNGVEAFWNLVNNAKSGFVFQKDYYLSKKDFTTLAGKVDIVSKLIPIIAEFENSIEMRNAVSLVAQDLLIEESAILEELNRHLNKENNKKPKNKKSIEPLGVDIKERSLLVRSENQLLRAIFEKPERLQAIKEDLLLYGFSNVQNKEILNVLLSKEDINNFSREDIFASLSEEGKSKLSILLTRDFDFSKIDKIIFDCITQIKIAHLLNKAKEHEKKAQEFINKGDSSFSEEFMKSQKIRNEISELTKSINE